MAVDIMSFQGPEVYCLPISFVTIQEFRFPGLRLCILNLQNMEFLLGWVIFAGSNCFQGYVSSGRKSTGRYKVRTFG